MCFLLILLNFRFFQSSNQEGTYLKVLLLIKHCYIIVPIPSTTLVVLQTPLICTYLSCKKKGIFLFAREGKAWFFLETNFWYCVLILYLHFQHSIGAANPIPIMRSIWCEDLTLLLVMSPSWAGSSHSLSWGISSSVLLGSARLVAFSSELLFSAWRAFFATHFFLISFAFLEDRALYFHLSL